MISLRTETFSLSVYNNIFQVFILLRLKYTLYHFVDLILVIKCGGEKSAKHFLFYTELAHWSSSHKESSASLMCVFERVYISLWGPKIESLPCLWGPTGLWGQNPGPHKLKAFYGLKMWFLCYRVINRLC